ncbi:MAG TPA: Yip1 family protein [Gemmatimonadaceae bacterium]|nr:Yip1 family protein [Gemmatimonadaceae bacterium]
MSLIDRVKGILLTPRKEWPIIEAEPATTASIYSGYIAPLAAIPAIAGFIGLSLLGYDLLGSTFRTPIGSGVVGMVLRYVLSLVGIYVLALIIDALAPNFGGTKNPTQALKVAAYSATASWVAGIFLILPALSVLGILGLYSVYLLYLGLPVLMKVPADKSVGYTAIVIICAIVVWVIIGTIASRVVMAAPM